MLNDFTIRLQWRIWVWQTATWTIAAGLRLLTALIIDNALVGLVHNNRNTDPRLWFRNLSFLILIRGTGGIRLLDFCRRMFRKLKASSWRDQSKQTMVHLYLCQMTRSKLYYVHSGIEPILKTATPLFCREHLGRFQSCCTNVWYSAGGWWGIDFWHCDDSSREDDGRSLSLLQPYWSLVLRAWCRQQS